MSRTTLQIPLDTDLRKEAEEGALEQGFSSLQEAVRVFLKKLAQRTVSFKVEEGMQLSDEESKRYDEMTDDVLSGKVKPKTVHTTDELMDYLNS